MSAFYTHHPNVSTTFIQLLMWTQVDQLLLTSVQSVIRGESEDSRLFSLFPLWHYRHQHRNKTLRTWTNSENSVTLFRTNMVEQLQCSKVTKQLHNVTFTGGGKRFLCVHIFKEELVLLLRTWGGRVLGLSLPPVLQPILWAVRFCDLQQQPVHLQVTFRASCWKTPQIYSADLHWMRK